MSKPADRAEGWCRNGQVHRVADGDDRRGDRRNRATFRMVTNGVSRLHSSKWRRRCADRSTRRWRAGSRAPPLETMNVARFAADGVRGVGVVPFGSTKNPVPDRCAMRHRWPRSSRRRLPAFLERSCGLPARWLPPRMATLPFSCARSIRRTVSAVATPSSATASCRAGLFKRRLMLQLRNWMEASGS